MRWHTRAALTAALLAPGVLAVAVMQAPDAELLQRARAVFKPVSAPAAPAANSLAARRIALGKMLYYDPRLSRNGIISCNTCHNLATHGVDNLPTSLGHLSARGKRNAPTVLNAAKHVGQFWDGREKTLEDQAKGPIVNPVEMAMPSSDIVIRTLRSIPGYVNLFKAAYPSAKQPVTYDNVAAAIGAFERTLVTPARFDAFLRGNVKALSARERKGLKVFLDAGCATCHHGADLGGSMYWRFGVSRPYWELTGSTQQDEGRFEVTKQEADKYVFKVPGLRHVTGTYPYFHDGSVWDLTQANQVMAEAQTGRKLSAKDAADMTAFMQSLTGTVPRDAREMPILPLSGPQTPRPAND